MNTHTRNQRTLLQSSVTFYCCLNISEDANLFTSQIGPLEFTLHVFVFRTQMTVAIFISNLFSHQQMGTILFL